MHTFHEVLEKAMRDSCAEDRLIYICFDDEWFLATSLRSQKEMDDAVLEVYTTGRVRPFSHDEDLMDDES